MLQLRCAEPRLPLPAWGPYLAYCTLGSQAPPPGPTAAWVRPVGLPAPQQAVLPAKPAWQQNVPGTYAGSANVVYLAGQLPPAVAAEGVWEAPGAQAPPRAVPSFPERPAPRKGGMVEFDVEDFAFVLQVGDVSEDRSWTRTRLKLHPEPDCQDTHVYNSHSDGFDDASRSPQAAWHGRRAEGGRWGAVEGPRWRGGSAPRGGRGSAAWGGNGHAPRPERSKRHFGRAGRDAWAWARPAVAEAPRLLPGNLASAPVCSYAAPATAPPPLAAPAALAVRSLPSQQDRGGATSAEQAELCNKWHFTASSAGSVSEDGHAFTKFQAQPQKKIKGMTLSSLCILLENRIRNGGVHHYRYSILAGSVGSADGVGFVFDTRLRRTNIQRMRSIFLNRRGQVCFRNQEIIQKTPNFLPKLCQGAVVYLTIDLIRCVAIFEMDDPHGNHVGTGDLSFESLLLDPARMDSPHLPASGFFCAIVTDNIMVSLH